MWSHWATPTVSLTTYARLRAELESLPSVRRAGASLSWCLRLSCTTPPPPVCCNNLNAFPHWNVRSGWEFYQNHTATSGLYNNTWLVSQLSNKALSTGQLYHEQIRPRNSGVLWSRVCVATELNWAEVEAGQDGAVTGWAGSIQLLLLWDCERSQEGKLSRESW